MVRKASIERVFYRSALRNALIPIFTLEILLLALYFGITRYNAVKTEAVVSQQVTQHVKDVIQSEADRIALRLDSMLPLMQMLAADHQDFFANPDRCHLPNGQPTFAVHANGVLHKTPNNGGSSLYYAASTVQTAETRRKALCSESLDPLLKSVVNGDELISQAYFNSWDNMNRMFPFLPDAPGVFGPGVSLLNHNF